MKRNLSAQLSVFQQAQDNHKDIVIGTLKKELNDLRDLETDFLRLTDQINRLESKYTLLLEQKTRNEKQHKLKMDINKKGITDMRNDVDALKIQIHKTISLIENTIGQNSTLKKMCDNRNNDIASLMSQNRELEKMNDQQAEQNRNISFNIKQLKQQKGKLEAECERLHDLLDSNVQILKNSQKQARILESNNAKLDNNLLQAERDNQKLLLELKQRQDSSFRTNKNLDDLIAKTESTKDRNKQLQGECLRLEGQCQSTNNVLNTQVGKNKQLISKLRSMDNMIRATQSQLQQSLSKKQNLKKEHFQLIGDNKSLNEQIDNCILSIVQYQKINEDLQRQIENYIETDQLARSKLNRKDAMRSLLQQVNNKLEKTSDQIAHLRS